MTIINTSEITFNIPKDNKNYNEFLKRLDESVTWHVEQRKDTIKYKRVQVLFTDD